MTGRLFPCNGESKRIVESPLKGSLSPSGLEEKEEKGRNKVDLW